MSVAPIIQLPICALAGACRVLTIHYSLFNLHYSLLTAHRSQLTVHRSLFTIHCSLLTVHGSRFTVHGSRFTAHHSPFTIHRSPFTVHRSPFTIHLVFSFHPSQLCTTLTFFIFLTSRGFTPSIGTLPYLRSTVVFHMTYNFNASVVEILY